jgi:membrane-bound lytic murein transglycosylase F
MTRRIAAALISMLLLSMLALGAHGMLPAPNQLQRVSDSGVLRAIVSQSPTSTQPTPDGLGGLEFELLQAFADALGLELVLLTAESEGAAYHALRSGAVDLIAAGLETGQSGNGAVRYSSTLFELPYFLIKRKGESPLTDLAALAGREDAALVVPDHSAITDRLRAAQTEHPGLRWQASRQHPEQLLYAVWNREIAYTVVDQASLMMTQTFYPELRIGPQLGAPRRIAWALAGGDDPSLAEALEEFLDAFRHSGQLAGLQEQHLGHLERFDYVDTRVFLRQITERLPEFRDEFVRAGEAHGLDWRLLAAMGYQESHWNPRAVSPTGVRGIMMLTARTAQDLNVVDRTDPVESIRGGARYLRAIHDRLPAEITEPDRTWLAMAAYNVGPGHLEDARRLAEQFGGNPNRWGDVKAALPLLADPEWHPHTRHGFARGQEPVDYVRRIRVYHDLLSRVTEPDRPQSLDAYATRYQPEQHAGNRLARVLQSLL